MDDPNEITKAVETSNAVVRFVVFGISGVIVTAVVGGWLWGSVEALLKVLLIVGIVTTLLAGLYVARWITKTYLS